MEHFCNAFLKKVSVILNQRLTTFKRYINNEFALTGLGEGRSIKHQNNILTGQKFSDLPLNLQERIEDTQLTLYIIDSKAPERAKLDIFERVNSGVPLTRQQMRNCLYNGKATKMLKDMADSKIFLQATGGSLNKKSMRDREAVNRFCAFYILGHGSYKGDMDSFLAEALEKMNLMDVNDLDDLYNRFRTSMRINLLLFDKHAFRKSLGYDDAKRHIINISLFDVCSVLFSKLDQTLVENNADFFKKCVAEMLHNKDFNEGITYSTNSSKSVTSRFVEAEKVIERSISLC